MAVAEKSATPETTPDPYDLGDTELYPRLEVEPYQKPTTPVVPVASEEPGSTTPAPIFDEAAKRWKDPVTKLFVKAPSSPETAAGTGNAPSQAVAHPEWLVQDAKSAGLTPEDFRDTEALYRNVRRATQEQLQLRSEQNVARILSDSHERTRAAAQPKEPAVSPPDLGIPKEQLEELHPAIVQLFNSLKAELTSTKEELAGIKNFQAQRQFESYAQAMHRVISEHADPALVGNGHLENFDWNSDAAPIRTAISDMARRLAGEKAGHADVIRKVPEAIHRLRYGKPKATEAKPAPEKNGQRYTPEEWKAAGLAAPSHRNGASDLPKGEALAIANLEIKQRDMGISPGSDLEAKEIEETLLP